MNDRIEISRQPDGRWTLTTYEPPTGRRRSPQPRFEMGLSAIDIAQRVSALVGAEAPAEDPVNRDADRDLAQAIIEDEGTEGVARLLGPR